MFFVFVIFLCPCGSNCTTIIFLEFVEEFSFLSAEKRRYFLVQTEQVIFSNAFKLLLDTPNGAWQNSKVVFITLRGILEQDVLLTDSHEPFCFLFSTVDMSPITYFFLIPLFLSVVFTAICYQ